MKFVSPSILITIQRIMIELLRLHRKKSMLDSKSHKVIVPRLHLLHSLSSLFSRGKSENHHEQAVGKEKRLEDGRNRGRIHVSVSAGKIHRVYFVVRNERSVEGG